MTLSEMRTALQDNCRDDGTYLTSARSNRFINQGMHHVANLIASQRPHLMMTSQSVTPTGGTAGVLELLTLTLRCKSLIRGRLSTGENLQKVPANEAENHLKHVVQAQPKMTEYNSTIALLEPAASLTIVVHYVYGLTDMTADNDTPGVVGGGGTANAIPPEYHPLITDFATLQALSADGRDPGGWLPVYQARGEALGLDLRIRRRFQS